MIHRAASNGDSPAEVGWGRFLSDPNEVITCDDHEVVVVYKRELRAREYLRAKIPLPPKLQKGYVNLEATLLISTDVDPAHSSAYTRSGVEVFFRPHSEKYAKGENGKTPMHPKTEPFLTASSLYGASEVTLRESGYKWEPARRAQIRKLASSLKNPCFDIYCHHRQNGVAAATTAKTKYALVVTVSSKNTKDLYDQVVRTDAHILIPMRPQVQIEIPT